jgi:hypothetical protein
MLGSDLKFLGFDDIETGHHPIFGENWGINASTAGFNEIDQRFQKYPEAFHYKNGVLFYKTKPIFHNPSLDGLGCVAVIVYHSEVGLE